MENSLIQQAKAFFNQDVLNHLSNSTGESAPALQKGLGAVIPAIFLGLQNKDSSTLQNILHQAKGLFGSFDISKLIPSTQEDHLRSGETVDLPQHNDMISSIFGHQSAGLISSLASAVGLRSESIHKILGVGIPAVFSSITKQGSSWDLSNISSLLNSNKDSFSAALPAGLSLGALGGMLGIKEQSHDDLHIPPLVKPDLQHSNPVVTPPSSARIHQEPVNPTPPPVEENEKKGAGYWWLLIPVLLLIGWLLFGKGCSNKNTVPATNDSTAVQSPVVDSSNTNVGPVNSTTRELVSLNLPNGNTINAYAGGIEDNLIAFLVDNGYKNMSEDELKETWFDFDNLNFETGTAKVLPESKQQLINLAAILKVFPDAKVKIGGYTDRTGNEEFNKKLSADRAVAVKDFLAENNLGHQVVDTEGYGSQFSKYDAQAPESDRVKDRRVSVSVRN